MRWCADTESTSRHKTTSHNGEMLIDRLDSAQPPAFCFLFNALTSGATSWGSRGVPDALYNSILWHAKVTADVMFL